MAKKPTAKTTPAKSRQIKSHTYDSRALNLLGALLCDTDSAQEAALLLEELLTPAELSAIVNRVAILRELENNASYEDIQQKLGVSSATIANISESKAHPSIKRLLSKLNRQESALRLANILGKFLGFAPR